jgi:hypothetical protein
VSKQTRELIYNFRGAQAPPLVASRDGGPWCRKVTGAAPPTVRTTSSGLELALTAANEVQVAVLYMGDILPFDIDDLIAVEWLAKLSASPIAASVSGVLGVASAQNDTLDNVAEHAWFRFEGTNALLAETDDGTTDLDDKATGETLGTSFKRLRMDFAQGVHSQDPPSLSKGGKAHIHFLTANANGSLRRVAAGTRFDASAYGGGLQLIAQIQKTVGTAVGTLTVLEAMVEYRLPE